MSIVFESTVSAALVDGALATSRPRSFWLERTPGDRAPRLSADLRADLVVVGGGYTGLWTALKAKQRDPGARVVLLEGARIGGAASGRNGGFAEASLTHGEENGRSRFPEEYEALEAMGVANLDAMEQAVRGFSRPTGWERTGSISVATEPHQVEWLREAADGEQAVFLDETAVRAEIHSPAFRAGLLLPNTTAIVDPAQLADAIAHAAREAGVELFEQSPAVALEQDGAGVAVRTRDGAVVRADRAVLATGVFPSLLKRLRLHTVPVYDYVLMTEPLTDAQRSRIGWTGRQGLSDSANQFHYSRLTDDGRILWGGYDAIYHYGKRVRRTYEDRPESYRKLAAHFFTAFPQLDDVRFSHHWAGAIDTCTRFCAFFGTARGGRVAYALGYTGLGVAATHFGAEVALDLLSGTPTERTSTRMVRETPLPFPPEPAAWLGIQATRAALDAADHNQGRRGPLLKILDAAGLGFDS